MNSNSKDNSQDYIYDNNSTPNFKTLKSQNLPDVIKETQFSPQKRLNFTMQKTHILHKIEFNRLINKENVLSISELIKCKICFNVLINPFDCESCGNTFCHNCIDNLRINQKPCLYNCENFQIKPSSFGITSLLSTLSFECLNKESGCNAVIHYLDVINHDKECTYQSTICPNFKCNRSIKRQLLEYHIRKECQYSLFKCENCEMNFIRTDYLQHVKNCKQIEDIFDLKNPIINNEEQIDLQEMSLKNFMKILLYNLSKNNKEFDKKLTSLSEEVKSIKEVVNRQTNNTMLLIENLHSEVDYINERLIGNEFHFAMNEKNSGVCVDTIVDENLRQTVLSGNNSNHSKTSSNNSSCCNSFSTNQTVIKTEPNMNSNTNTTNSESNKTNSRNVKVTAGNIGENNQNTTVSNVKKIKIENKTKTQGGNQINIKANKSPLARMPPGRSPADRSPNPRTLYLDTESSQTRTGHMALLKTTLKNQEIIQESINKVIHKVEEQEVIFNQKMDRYSDEIKDFIKFFLIEKNDFDY